MEYVLLRMMAHFRATAQLNTKVIHVKVRGNVGLQLVRINTGLNFEMCSGCVQMILLGCPKWVLGTFKHYR
jgi:hypothetical protein